MNSDVSTALAGWLAAHHSVISAKEAHRMGATGQQVAWKVRCGEWERVGRGVYRLAGSPVTPAGELRAAVLLAGEGAAASHWSTAWLWGIADLPARP
ncbi:MAG TPA: type IV toxin-antitoxin system AbiEi family antitoxin domain-containing protein, partial [Acidimicrobiales bacterium]|nr:type IV toxin-antitoxin system AbiEi family antitoxin domain-containing protein [Acidimicrobiales bacterium]